MFLTYKEEKEKKKGKKKGSFLGGIFMGDYTVPSFHGHDKSCGFL